MAKAKAMVLYLNWGPPAWRSCPICTSRATTLDNEATGFVFGAITTMNSVSKMREGRKKLGAFLKF